MFQLRLHVTVFSEDEEQWAYLKGNDFPLLFVNHAIGDEFLQYLIETSEDGLKLQTMGIQPCFGDGVRLSLLQLPSVLRCLNLRTLKLELIASANPSNMELSIDPAEHLSFGTLSNLCPNLRNIKIDMALTILNTPEMRAIPPRQLSLKTNKFLDILRLILDGFGLEPIQQLSELERCAFCFKPFHRATHEITHDFVGSIRTIHNSVKDYVDPFGLKAQETVHVGGSWRFFLVAG